MEKANSFKAFASAIAPIVADNTEVANIGQVFHVLDRSKFQVIEYIQENFCQHRFESETG